MASRREAFVDCSSADSFCPIVRGLPRAMLAPDAERREAENKCCLIKKQRIDN
jgi:hypothetical protein